jgi:hypothetical protein
MSVMLTLLMGKRFLASRKMMPAGMTTVEFGINSFFILGFRNLGSLLILLVLVDGLFKTLSLVMAVRYGVKLLEK